MTSRRTFVAFAATSALAFPRASRGQPATKLRRIGVLSGGYASSHRLNGVLLEELRALGWIEGRTLAVEVRYAEGRYDRLPALADELVRARVELIAAGPGPAAVAARKATSTLPIVMLLVGDPVGLGLVESLARPGGNVTGTAFDVGFDVFRKQLELLRETMPAVERVAVVANPANPGYPIALRALETAASSMGWRLVVVDARGPEDFDAAFDRMTRERAGAVLVVTDAALNPHAARLVALAAGRRLPAIYTTRSFVDAGGLMAYGPSFEHVYRRTAPYIDRILRGAKPADLPVEQPTQFELAVNLPVARALGLTLPPALIARADVVVR